MNQKDKTFLQDYNEFVVGLYDGVPLKGLIMRLKSQISNLKDWTLQDECMKIEETYDLMLKYFSEGVVDKDCHVVYRQLSVRLFRLAQRVRRQRGVRESSNCYYAKVRTVGMQSRTMTYYTKRLRSIGMQDLFLSITNDSAEGSESMRKSLVEEFFDYIWTVAEFSDEDYADILSFFDEACISDEEKQWLVSALTLSSLFYYDVHKIRLLMSLTEYSDGRVACRAYVGLALTLMVNKIEVRFNESFTPKPPLSSKLSSTWSMLQVLCFYITRTNRIDKEVDQNFMPLIMNMQHSVTPEQLQELLGDEDADLPEGIDPEVVNKIRKSLRSMAKEAVKGLDMYYSGFSKMKNGVFFSEVRNWLKPFALNTSGDDNILCLIDGAAENNMLCDSDKYSLATLLSSVPSGLKKQIEEMSSAIAASGHVRNTDEIAQQREVFLRSRYLEQASSFNFSSRPAECLMYALDYLKDLYRLFNIKFKGVSEANPFYYDRKDNTYAYTPLTIVSNSAVTLMINDEDIESLAREASNQHFYGEAIGLYRVVKRERTNEDLQLLAFWHAMIGDYDTAVDIYYQVDIKQMSPEMKLMFATCLQRCRHGVDDKYLRLAKSLLFDLDSEHHDIVPLLNYGKLLIRCGQFYSALKPLYEEDYLRPGQASVERQIVKCLLQVGDAEQALSYCEKLLDNPGIEISDYMNIGHAYFIHGDTLKALECYRKIGDAFFFTENDYDILDSYGIKTELIGIMADAVRCSYGHQPTA